MKRHLNDRAVITVLTVIASSSLLALAYNLVEPTDAFSISPPVLRKVSK